MNLTQKIWFLMTAPFVVAVIVYLLATRPFRREMLLREADREVRDDVVVLQAAIAKGLVDEKTQNADLIALVESIAHAERVLGVAVYDHNGVVLARSEAATGERVDSLARRALAGGGGDLSELREERGKTILEHAVRLERAGPASGGVAVVLRDIGYVDHLLFGWNVRLAVMALIFTALMLAGSRPIVRRVLGEPLDTVVDGVERVAAGDLDTRVPDERRDELGRLARAFNAMTESLRNARARAEEEHASRAALEGRMRQVQTLAAAGEVAASLAHEIGSPLNVILGRTRMIAGRPDTTESARKDLEIVAEQTERITRVVQKLLSISRPANPKRELVAVRPVVEETLAFVAPECRKRKISTHVEVADGAPSQVLANRDQLMQIMFNLCYNAMQAQPGGGSIDVRLSGCTDEISGAEAVEIDVSDAGPGIEPSMRGRIFDPFVSTKRGEGGTGLGLAIVDGMVRELGGRVEVDDGAKGGACFRVKIPVAQQEVA